MKVRLEFKLQDCWIGAFWRPGDLWICLVPCFPIHISWATPRQPGPAGVEQA